MAETIFAHRSEADDKFIQGPGRLSWCPVESTDYRVYELWNSGQPATFVRA